MPAALTLPASSVDELDDFARALEAIGVQAWRSTIGAARTFRHRVDQAGGWERVELDTQLEWMRRARPFVSWLLITGHLERLDEQACYLDPLNALRSLRLIVCRNHNDASSGGLFTPSHGPCTKDPGQGPRP